MPGVYTTLGKDPSFHVLMEILLEWEEKAPNLHLQRQVTKHLHNFRARIASLRGVGHPRHREEFLVAVRNRFIEDVVNSGWPNNVQTHTRTCLTTIYRNEVRQVQLDAREWNKARREQSRQANAMRA